MITTFNNYIDTFLHPVKERTEENRLSFHELLGMSWMLNIIYALYSLFAIYYGSMAYSRLYLGGGDPDDFFSQVISFDLQKYNIITIVFTILLYPFIFQFTYKFFVWAVGFFSDVFGKEVNEDFKLKINDMVMSIFSTNILLLIPVIGKFLSMMVGVYYFFIGTTLKLGFTKTQALILLATPLFVVGLMTTYVIAYFTFIAKLIF